MTDQSLIKTIANIITNQLVTYSTKYNKPLEQLISKEHILELATLFNQNKISNQGLSKAIELVIENPNSDLNQILKENKLTQTNDIEALQPIVDVVLSTNLAQVEQYKSGKVNIIGFLVGQCMKQAGGSGNPKIFNELLAAKLS